MITKIDRSILFEQVFQFSSMGIALVSTNGKFLLTNPMLSEILGYSETELKGKSLRDLTYPEDLQASLSAFHQLLSNEISYYQVEKRYIHREGQLVWCLLNVSAVKDDEGNPMYAISQFQDITERKLYEHQLKENEQKLKDILETFPNGVLTFDLTGSLQYVNNMAEEILEFKQKDILSRQYDAHEWAITTIEGNPIAREDLPVSIVMKTEQYVKDYVHTVVSGSNQRKVLSVNGTPLYDHTGKLTAALLSIVDITVKKQTESELIQANKLLKRLSERDGLTGVSNRRHFDNELQNYWESSLNNHTPLSLIMLDIDYFKLYNDEYGHQAGDDCLKSITKAIDQKLTDTETVFARYGGEEFAIILPDYSAEAALNLAQKLHQSIQKLSIPHTSSPLCDEVTVSFGISTILPNQENKSSELIENADKALYAAKEDGRNSVKTYMEVNDNNTCTP
ncbi:sensor domain-containing diguanylate cyclase [Salipaludibacillus sp. CF4.18]|uniref:GGDEF domain-containing protein n=1 Tax=Salipaludibacillus sp. CF4.18 TaxID=3373081 RepID=UPI003EE50C07